MPYIGTAPSSELANLDINGQKFILDADADTSITADTDDTIDIEIAGADDFQFTANTFTAKSGSTIAAQALTGTTGIFSSDVTGLTLNATGDTAAGDDAAIGYTASEGLILTGQGSTNDITIKNDADTNILKVATGTTVVDFATSVTVANDITVATAGEVFIGDTANGQITTGLTLNQGAADNEILSLKSSDVAHSNTGTTEADTYTFFKKYSGTDGGLTVNTNTENIIALWLDVVHDTQQDAAASNTAVCPYNVRAVITADSNAHDANVALFAWRKTISGGSSRNIVLFDEDGDIHLDGSTTAFDKEDDALLCRSFDLALADPKSIIKSEFDDWTINHKEKLVDAGILGRIDPDNPAHYSYPEQAVAGSPASDPSNPPVLGEPMINSTQLQRLHNGAIWQQRLMFETLKEVAEELLPGFASKLNERLESKHLPALPV